jgi:hypothetical protein
MRLKSRYLVVELIYEREVEDRDFGEAVDIVAADIYQWYARCGRFRVWFADSMSCFPLEACCRESARFTVTTALVYAIKR